MQDTPQERPTASFWPTEAWIIRGGTPAGQEFYALLGLQRWASREYNRLMIHSAGTLLYRHRDGGLEVLLIHPSGRYNRRAPWGIPKGIRDEGEDFEQAARRETLEETGVAPPDELQSLDFIQYHKARKQVHCFTGPAPADAQPRTASWEVDGAEFMPLEEARRRIHPDQLPFLDRLVALLAQSSESG